METKIDQINRSFPMRLTHILCILDDSNIKILIYMIYIIILLNYLIIE